MVFPAEKKIISSHTNLTDKLENARVRSREEKEVRKNIKDLEEESTTAFVQDVIKKLNRSK